MDKNRYLGELAEHPGARFWRAPFDALSRPEQVFRCVWELESDVSGGGFEQYFANSGGDHAWFAGEALRDIGAKQLAAITAEAVALFGAEAPDIERPVRHGQIAHLERPVHDYWEALSEAFCEYPDDLTELLYAYVLAHRDAFPTGD
ncbi:MAG TPA: DMP19 family protein [Patescibacteria group bacterium]|mgnify:FL=1|nr:DMP19 family protein [Patescibacteria group bacterium]